MRIVYASGAYGRTYSDKAAIVADWDAGEDFKDLSSLRYFSKRDTDILKADGVTGMHIITGGTTYWVDL